MGAQGIQVPGALASGKDGQEGNFLDVRALWDQSAEIRLGPRLLEFSENGGEGLSRALGPHLLPAENPAVVPRPVLQGVP